MGIDKSNTPPGSTATPPQAQAQGHTATVAPSPPPKRRSSIKSSTPLSRLSSALGFTASQLPSDPDPSPEMVDAALRAYDAEEKARRASLSKGQSEGGYTSPPRVGSLRRSAESGGADKRGHRSSGSWSK